MAAPNKPPSPRLIAYMQLFRLPNVFTAMTDVLLGFWFTHETLSPIGVFLLLLASSCLLYTGGMVLNDVFDLEQDRRERPQRPIPSGRITINIAGGLAGCLLISGMLAGCGAGLLAGDVRPAVLATLLAWTIISYDGILKHTPAGPVAMGACRMFNVLLGMSASPTPWTVANWVVAGGIGLYVVGVTWFARREASSSQRLQLIGATLTMLAGISLLRWWPKLIPSEKWFATLEFEPECWTWAWILIALAIGWRFVWAIIDPQPSRVQAAVKTGILSIIVLDAVTVFAVRGPMPAVAILLLIVPTVALGAWIYST
jgi:4-hydroxybenzoate polyprenyltransferase